MSISQKKRDDYLDRLKRPSCLIGVEIPETFNVQGKEIPLLEVVCDLTLAEKQDEASMKRAGKLIRLLKEEVKEREKRLMFDDVDEEEAEKIYQETLHLKRALKDLRSVGHRQGYDPDALEKEDVEDARRWVKFLDSLK